MYSFFYKVKHFREKGPNFAPKVTQYTKKGLMSALFVCKVYPMHSKQSAATSGAFQLMAVSLLAKEQRSSVYENPGCGPG